MSKYQLSAGPRTITGKKVKTLRANNELPATVYGKTTKPLTIVVNASEFTKLFQEAGETGLIELSINKEVHPVLVHNVQTHPVTKAVLHIEFHEVDLKEKVHAEIPVECIGEPQAIKEKLGVLLTLIDHIEVEALPMNLPEKITIDITDLKAVDEQKTVADLAVPSDVTVLTDPTVIVVKIGAFVVEKEPEPVATAEEVVQEAAPTGEEQPQTEEKSEEPQESK